MGTDADEHVRCPPTSASDVGSDVMLYLVFVFLSPLQATRPRTPARTAQRTAHVQNFFFFYHMVCFVCGFTTRWACGRSLLFTWSNGSHFSSCFFVLSGFFFPPFDHISTLFARRQSQKSTPKAIMRLWTRTGKGGEWVGKLTCGAISPVYFHTGCKFVMCHGLCCWLGLPAAGEWGTMRRGCAKAPRRLCAMAPLDWTRAVLIPPTFSILALPSTSSLSHRCC